MSTIRYSILEEIKLNAWIKRLSVIQLFNLQNRNRPLSSQNNNNKKANKKPLPTPFLLNAATFTFLLQGDNPSTLPWCTPRPTSVQGERRVPLTHPAQDTGIPEGKNCPAPPWRWWQNKPHAPQKHPLLLCLKQIKNQLQAAGTPVPATRSACSRAMAHSTQNYDFHWVAKWGKLTFYEV